MPGDGYFRPGTKLVLALGDDKFDVAVAENGEPLIPALEKILQSDDAILMVPKGTDAPKIAPRLRIKLPIKQQISKQQLINVMKQYQIAGKVLYGWASFLVPTLNCVAMQFAEKEGEVVAISDEKLPTARELKTSQKGGVSIEFAQPFETLNVLAQPLWVWGCSHTSVSARQTHLADIATSVAVRTVIGLAAANDVAIVRRSGCSTA